MAKETELNLAVYMERLDTYIDTQSKLNETLCNRFEFFENELTELQDWKSRFYGAKSIVTLMGIMLVHGAAVIASLLAVSTIMKD
tara:strand:+ start:1882 stop:2136 length:255 start_codon:yes stop_codon:yes gene_type:complete